MWSTGIDVVLRLSCSAACGIFPDQELNPSPALAGGFFFFFFFFLPQSQKGSPKQCLFTVPGLKPDHHTAPLHLAVKSPESPQICLSWFSMILTLWKTESWPGYLLKCPSIWIVWYFSHDQTGVMVSGEE